MAQIARHPDYSDLDLDFIPHPTTKDVVRKIGPDAIKRSVRNLIFTNYYDRLFRPGIGSSVNSLLFENSYPLIANFISNAITEVLRNYEPRISVDSVNVSVSNDSNGFNVSIRYTILNKSLPVLINLFLERIR